MRACIRCGALEPDSSPSFFNSSACSMADGAIPFHEHGIVEFRSPSLQFHSGLGTDGCLRRFRDRYSVESGQSECSTAITCRDQRRGIEHPRRGQVIAASARQLPHFSGGNILEPQFLGGGRFACDGSPPSVGRKDHISWSAAVGDLCFRNLLRHWVEHHPC